MLSFETISHFKKKKAIFFVKNSCCRKRGKKKRNILKRNFQSAISKDQGVGGVPQRAGEQLKGVWGGAWEGAWRNIREQQRCVEEARSQQLQRRGFVVLTQASGGNRGCF